MTTRRHSHAKFLGGAGLIGLMLIGMVRGQGTLNSARSVAPSPRYIYTPGYYGCGYYQQYAYPSPSVGYSAPREYVVPRYYGSASSGRRNTRDWTTGRETPIAKPWLRPMD